MLAGLFVFDNSPRSRTATRESRPLSDDQQEFKNGSGSHLFARGVLASMGVLRRKPDVSWLSVREVKWQPCLENTIFYNHLRNGTLGWKLKSRATTKDSLVVRFEGKRWPRHRVIPTDLDAIMSVVSRFNRRSRSRICHSVCAPFACIRSSGLLEAIKWFRRASRRSSRSPMARYCRAPIRVSPNNGCWSGFQLYAAMVAHPRISPVYPLSSNNDLLAEVFV